MKEIYNLINDKYEHANKTLNSLQRTPYDLQTQLLYSLYFLNIKKRKVNRIPYEYCDLQDLKKRELDVELFVINTSVNRLYSSDEYEFIKIFLEKKFSKPTKYEIFLEENNENNEKNEEDNEKNEYDTNEQQKILHEMMKKYIENHNQTIKILVNKINENKKLIEEQKILMKI